MTKRARSDGSGVGGGGAPDAQKKARLNAATYLADHDIIVHEQGMPPPVLSLRLAPFPPPLVRLLCRQGFSVPSPVQAATWPIASSGRDVLAIAKTGSGKTLGFLLPVLACCHRLKCEQRQASGPSSSGSGTTSSSSSSGGGGGGGGSSSSNSRSRKSSSNHNHNPSASAPKALIMAPTRELALQIHAEAEKFGTSLGLKSVAVYGGAKKGPQIAKLQRGCELIVGTPGRIKDVFQNAACRVDELSLLVLDEADRMLDMGFERDIRTIVWQAFGERPRQTFFFSATWPLDVQEVAADLLLGDAVKVTVGKGGNRLTVSKSVTQRVHVIRVCDRLAKFQELMASFQRGGVDAGKRVIVFANRKKTVKELANWCNQNNLPCDTMSGDRSQSQRETTVKKFREGRVTVVIATDVASRGLDIKGIARVINFELPVDNFMDYVHRIGRTGRAEATGEADSLFTDNDRGNSQALIKLMKDAGQVIPAALARYAPTKTTFDSSSDESSGGES